jgi:tRNA-2-methylthio-N6-dimethylallyladenosine synthase
MDDRLQRLQSTITRHQIAFNQASVGKTCTILIERKGRHPGQWIGKSPWLQSVWIATSDGREAAIGDSFDVELAEAGPNSLMGLVRETVAI